MTKIVISKLDMPICTSGKTICYNAQLFTNGFYAGYGRYCETLAEAYAKQNADSYEIA